jgi:hypothetical protein
MGYPFRHAQKLKWDHDQKVIEKSELMTRLAGVATWNALLRECESIAIPAAR